MTTTKLQSFHMKEEYYAIRNTMTGLYWDLRGPYGRIAGRGGKSKGRYHWNPKFQPDLKITKHHSHVMKSYTDYMIARQSDTTLPEIEIVSFVLVPQENHKAQPSIPANDLEVERLYTYFGKTLASSAARLGAKGYDLTKFEYAIKRKGSNTKKYVKFLQDSASQDMYTFISDETTLLQAKLTLGKECATVYRLKETSNV